MTGFTLSMPNVGSWNGRWSGENKIYFIKRKLCKKQEAELDGKYFHYSFGDGWSAGISCKKIDAKESAKLNRRSAGFCGYDWMVNSILKFGKILNSRDQEKIKSVITEIKYSDNTSTNKAMDAICSDDICVYCERGDGESIGCPSQSHDTMLNCFRGRKLLPC